MRVLGIITARGGSRGIPRKNIAPLHGRPLLAWTVAAAKDAASLTRLIISTDSDEIARVARELGVEVPFLRPPHLAQDSTPTLPVLQHAVRHLEEDGDAFDAILTLQPTNPLRTSADIDGAIELMQRTGADSVISFTDTGERHPARMKVIDADGRVLDPQFAEAFEGQPRQMLTKYYLRDGSIYLTRRSVLMDSNSLKGRDCRAWLIPPERACNIDTALDLFIAEKLMTYGDGSAANHINS